MSNENDYTSLKWTEIFLPPINQKSAAWQDFGYNSILRERQHNKQQDITKKLNTLYHNHNNGNARKTMSTIRPLINVMKDCLTVEQNGFAKFAANDNAYIIDTIINASSVLTEIMKPEVKGVVINSYERSLLLQILLAEIMKDTSVWLTLKPTDPTDTGCIFTLAGKPVYCEHYIPLSIVSVAFREHVMLDGTLFVTNENVLNKETKRNSILDAVHETATDLHNVGIIDDKTKHEFDQLCQKE